MKADSFITELGHILQEDFTYAPVWTKTELLYYLQLTVNEFVIRTLLADKSQISLVNATSGETAVPDRFHSCYYARFNDARVDIVNISELDFVSQTWTLGATATTPLAATVYGAGNNATVKFVPVPSTVTGAFVSGTVTTLTVTDSGSNVWTVTVNGGELVTTLGGTAIATVVIAGVSTYWDLGITTTGRLTLTASASTSPSDVILADTSGSAAVWNITATDDGRLVTSDINYGTTVAMKLDGTYQDMTAGANSSSVNYGCVFDLYATGSSTTPTSVARLDSPLGTLHVLRSSTYAADIWCKLNSMGVPALSSEIPVSVGFLPVIKHGVLAYAYGHPYEGHDAIKSTLMRKIFVSECETIKRIFGRV